MSRTTALSMMSAALLAGAACPALANVAAAPAHGARADAAIVRMAANDVGTQTKVKVRKTRRVKTIGKPKVGQEKQLNPQPEPPLPGQGPTWLNPQPEPPKPGTMQR